MSEKCNTKKVDFTLLVAFCFGLIAMFSLLYMRDQDSVSSPSMPNTLPFNHSVAPYPQQNNVQSQHTLHDLKVYLEPWIDQKLSDLERKTWMLGVAHNENTALTRSMAESMNRSDLASKYIVFDRDWNFNKVPELQSISDEDRRELIKKVKFNVHQTTHHANVVENQSVYYKIGCQNCR